MSKNLKKLNDSFLIENEYIFKKYKPIKKIGQGKFGNIYSTIRIKDKCVFAMKTEKLSSNNKILESEAYYLYTLQGFGIPKLISFGHIKKYNILIETLLDKSLFNLFFENNIKCNIYDICYIGMQILDRLEFIHSKDIIYRDVKPENFLIGINDPNVIYIIDFGLCKKYRSSKTGKHILPKLTGKFSGNFLFASSNVIKGKESSRRDDLISLGYMLIFLLKKNLPWYFKHGSFNKKKYFEIVYLKDNDGCGKLFNDLPKEFVEFVKYTKHLKFEQDPDYSYLHSLLNKVIFNRNIDYKQLSFSWINPKDKILFANQRSNSKKRTSPHMRILNNIKEQRIKRRKSEALSQSNAYNNFNNIPTLYKIQYSDYRDKKIDYNSKRNILKRKNNIKIINLNSYKKENEENSDKIITKNSSRNNLRIVNVKQFPQSLVNNNSYKNINKKNNLNTVSYFNNSEIKIKSRLNTTKASNIAINANAIPVPLILSGNSKNNNYNLPLNYDNLYYINSHRIIPNDHINYLFRNNNSINNSKKKKELMNISNQEYKSPLNKNNIKKNISKNFIQNKYHKFQKIHKKYMTLLNSKRNLSIDLGNSFIKSNNNRNNNNALNIILINNYLKNKNCVPNSTKYEKLFW